MGDGGEGGAKASPGRLTEMRQDQVGDFDEFFDVNYPLLLRIAMSLGATFHEAEDAAEETMSYLYRRWREIYNPQAYARTAVISNFRKAARRDGQRVARTVAGCQVTPAVDECSALNAWEDRAWVMALLSNLPSAQREVMACVYDGLNSAEIAALLGKTEQTVRKNLQLARGRLRRELAEAKERQRQGVRGNSPAPRQRGGEPE